MVTSKFETVVNVELVGILTVVASVVVVGMFVPLDWVASPIVPALSTRKVREAGPLAVAGWLIVSEVDEFTCVTIVPLGIPRPVTTSPGAIPMVVVLLTVVEPCTIVAVLVEGATLPPWNE